MADEMINDSAKYHRDYYVLRRNKIIDYLGGACAVCGARDDLQIDHINRDDKSFNISSNLTISNSAVRDELGKCQVLCRFHHQSKTAIENSGFTHGSVYAWMKKKCNCDVCATARGTWYANRNAARRNAQERGPYQTGPVACGTDRSYRKGCRCAECRAAHASRLREYRLR